jgi:hypothetical protein
MVARRSGVAVADRLRSLAMTVLGIILSLVPPALWVAWSETVLVIVVAVALASATLLIVLADWTAGVEERRPTGSAPTRGRTDEAVAEIHRIFPLTYHHSVIEKARFRQAMQKVRQLLK